MRLLRSEGVGIQKDILRWWLKIIACSAENDFFVTDRLVDQVYGYIVDHPDIYHKLYDNLLERMISEQHKLQEELKRRLTVQ